MEKAIHQIEQVRRIYVYYNINDHRQSGQSCLLSGLAESKKFEFCLERNLEKQLENAETGGAVDPSRPIDRPMIDNITDIQIERIGAKRGNNSDRYSPVPKRYASTVQHDFIEKNNNPRFICPICKTFFQKPYQLECGHWLCESCVNNKDNICCPICSKFILKNKAWFDRGFENELYDLLTTCLECAWTGSFKFYQKHANQNHQEFSNNSISNEQVNIELMI
ncbi:unnamed protein product [Rotaria sordida]|uniref:RING-type domain-containing protein n=1 Tax=Rotaria sordida TaxID=392033 RepID=A0A814MA40_9BILA|nr:unnamed protein product [Rotaria sordida]CAF1076099.1 unnamed protein product [Rotaria sordida]CAF4022881.1 unnamed protein product [Rotaria sordida]CAF4079681.1 unnamed protein product [Rotaria sordida]